MHLIEGNELDVYEIERERKGKTLSAKHVRIEFSSTHN